MVLPILLHTGALKIIFLISQPKHLLWVLKRTVSLRQLFCWVPKTNHVQIQRRRGVGGGGGGGGTGVQTPLKNHKNIGFLSNSGLDHLKITKLPSEHSMLGHHQHASETPCKLRFPGGLMMALLRVVFGSSLSSSTKKKNIRVEPPYKTFWIQACKWWVRFTLKNFPNMDQCGKRYRNALSAFKKNKWVYSLMTYQKETPLE